MLIKINFYSERFSQLYIYKNILILLFINIINTITTPNSVLFYKYSKIQN